MAHLSAIEWDRMLQSRYRLGSGVGLRYDGRCGPCLHELASGRIFALEDWQWRLLRQLDGGETFSAAVAAVLRDCCDRVGREDLRRMMRGLLHHRLLIAEKPERKAAAAAAARLSAWADRRRRQTLAWVGGGLSALSMTLVVAAWGASHFPEWVAAGDRELMAAAGSERDSSATVPVRVWCRGVVTAFLVREGDLVRSGDILARVADPMAEATRDDLRSQLGECRMRRDACYRSGDLVGYLNESKNLARLAGLLSQWEMESYPVVLRAPVDGRVLHLDDIEAIGHPVNPGDVLLSIEATGDAVAALATGDQGGLIAAASQESSPE